MKNFWSDLKPAIWEAATLFLVVHPQCKKKRKLAKKICEKICEK